MNKYRIFFISILCILCGIIVSCSEDEYIETDYTPVGFSFKIVSADGTDLLADGQSLHGADFSVIYEGEEYKADWRHSRMYLPHLYGLRYSIYEDNPVLLFGEFDGYRSEVDFVFKMPNGESHNIYLNRRHGKNDKVKQIVKLDGKEVSEMSDGRIDIEFTFVYQE